MLLALVPKRSVETVSEALNDDGDTATISNYYWGNKIVATLSSIQTDKKNPMTNKTLTFNLEGDVTSGSELTVSVGQKSARYDTIIPNSAIRTDSNGSFVLAVTAKNSPLGNRYIAKRVAIEVLAADDTNSAVTADLNNGDYVITTSSAPSGAVANSCPSPCARISAFCRSFASLLELLTHHC